MTKMLKKIRRKKAIFALFLLMSTVNPIYAVAAQKALIVAIGSYYLKTISLGPKDKDIANATKILDTLWKFKADEISILRDDKATKRNILRTFRSWLIESTEPGDRVIFYYSGHGSQVRDRDGDEKDGFDETLSVYDTYADGQASTGQITDDEIRKLIDQLKGRDVTLIFDSCHSGTVSRSVLPPNGDGNNKVRTFFKRDPENDMAATRGEISANRVEEPFIQGGDRLAVWSAASASQLSYESRDGVGVFTSSFVEGAVSGKADSNHNGITTNAEVLDFARSATQQFCEKQGQCPAVGFTPQLEASAAQMAAPINGTETVPASPVDEVVDVVGGGNSAGLALAMTPAGKIKLGQSIQIEVTGRKAGWLVLLDVNAEGKIVQLYPNDLATKHGGDGKIGAGRPITIPDAYYGFDFKASEPTGKGALIAIVTEDAVPLEDLVKPHGDFATISDPDAYLAELAKRLREIWTADHANRALNWSMAELPYEIEP